MTPFCMGCGDPAPEQHHVEYAGHTFGPLCSWCNDTWLWDDEQVTPEPMEHTDRQALQAEHDNDNAAINAQIEGLA